MDREVVVSWETLEGLEINQPILPAPLDQEQREICVPMAVHTDMTALMTLDTVKHHLPPPPELSLEHLIDVHFDQQTLSAVLDWIAEHGIVAREDYHRRNEDGVKRYRILYENGYNPRSRAFDEHIQRELRRRPLIAEIKVDKHYGRELEDVVYVPRGVYQKVDVGGVRTTVSHAVTLTGWRRSPNDVRIEYFDYLNSYGTQFGMQGFGVFARRALHWVYEIDMEPQWWV